MQSAGVDKQAVVMLDFLNLLALSCLCDLQQKLRSCQRFLGKKKIAHVGQVLYAVSSQWWLACNTTDSLPGEIQKVRVSPANGMISINPTP